MEGGFPFGFSAWEANNGSINISHLLFAEDVLIFYEANHDHIQTLKGLLCFEGIYRLKKNLAKSKVMLVGGVPNVESMAYILGCKIYCLPMKYFGLPFGAPF